MFKNHVPFTFRVLSKIVSYLVVHEGFTAIEADPDDNGISTTIVDALGYSYEVKVKALGRVYHHPPVVQAKPLLERIK